MYHKESGTGNDPFLAENMLCRRWLLSPLRISALINLSRLFLPARETYHLDRRCTLSGKLPEHTLRSQVAAVSRYRAGCYGKSRRALMKPRPLPKRDKKTAKTTVIAVYKLRRKASSFGELRQRETQRKQLFVPCKIAKHVVTTFF